MRLQVVLRLNIMCVTLLGVTIDSTTQRCSMPPSPPHNPHLGQPSFPFVLDFDLGAGATVQSLALWNSSKGDDAAINALCVSTSDVADFSSSTAVGSFNNVLGSAGPEPVTVADLSDFVGHYVRINGNSYCGNPCCAAIGEVAFETAAAHTVPVPGSLPLAALGLFAAGWVRRRA